MEAFLHFLSRDRNRSKRARPCPAYPCASSVRPERAETHPPSLGLRRAQTVRALFSVRPADARRGTMGKPKSANHFKPPSRGLPEASRSAGGASLVAAVVVWLRRAFRSEVFQTVRPCPSV